MYEVTLFRYVADENHIMHFVFETVEAATTFINIALRHSDNARLEAYVKKRGGCQ